MLSGEKEQCKNEDCSCVADDIEGLPFKNICAAQFHIAHAVPKVIGYTR